MKVLITGSRSFVGSRVCELAQVREWSVSKVVRQATSQQDTVTVRSIDSSTDWSLALRGIDCVVHCAARVHQMQETESDALAVYREVNTHGTLNLAKQAAQAGVKRFVFISSIKVNGEYSEQGAPFLPEVTSIPTEPYGLSKYEAEIGLKQLSEETGLEVVVIRPPLVYGPGVKANFLSMMNWVYKGIPLPLGAIHNQRSLVFLDNLVDLILTCCAHPNAKGETFLVSDNEDVSTSQLLSLVAKAMDKSNRMLPIPMSWLSLAARLIGKPQIAQRLCGNLQVDISNTVEKLSWKPPYSLEYGIQKTVDAYLKSNTI